MIVPPLKYNVGEAVGVQRLGEVSETHPKRCFEI
jgi:hypothetical protein